MTDKAMEAVEDRRHRLMNSYGEGSVRDGQIDQAIREIDSRIQAYERANRPSAIYDSNLPPKENNLPGVVDPAQPDHSEGIKRGAFAPPPDPPPLPVDEKFLIYLDDEGDYIVEAQRGEQHQHLASHGNTPDDAIWRMRQTLDMVKFTQRANRPSAIYDSNLPPKENNLPSAKIDCPGCGKTEGHWEHCSRYTPSAGEPKVDGFEEWWNSGECKLLLRGYIVGIPWRKVVDFKDVANAAWNAALRQGGR